MRHSAQRAGTRVLSIAPRREDLRADVVAGLPGAISSVPDGMAAAVLAGVNPVQGLYASFAGPITGGLASSTRLMVITTTSAAALAAGSAVGSVSPGQRPDAILLVAIIAGLALVGAGIAGLGRYTRFVSHSVMVGFLTGIAVNIVCSQVSDLTGAPSQGNFPLAKALNVLTHPSRIDPASLLTGLAAIALLVLLARTPLAMVGTLVALLVPTVVVGLAGASSVARVGSVGEIPAGISLPSIPDLSLLSFGLVAGALSVAAIVLVQGAAVSEAAPNEDGALPNPNQDVVAQGLGNLASGIFRGIPVGGSVGNTALNVSVGARSRWAAIFGGLWMILILAAFSGLVAKMAMPTLAAILVYAAVRSVRVGEIATIMHTGRISQIAVMTTFLATLFLPIAAAVGCGIVISLLLQLNKSAMDLRVVELTLEPRGLAEHPAPAQLPSHQVTVLDVYGSLLFAGARTLEARLPDPGEAVEPVAVIRLRGRTSLGSTFVKVITDYAERLEEHGGRLYLSGLDSKFHEQLRRTGVLEGPVRTFDATPMIGESTRKAYEAAQAWLVRKRNP